MQFKYVALAGALLLAGGPAQAADAPDALSGYKADTVMALFNEMGATAMKSELIQGDPRLTFKFEKFTYVVDFHLCEDKAAGCKMLHYISAFDSEPSDTIEGVNAYNSEYVVGKAVFEKEGLLSLRSVLWSQGSGKAQIKSEFLSFVGATAVLLEHMKKYTVANNAPAAPSFVNTSVDGAATPNATLAKWRSLPRNRR